MHDEEKAFRNMLMYIITGVMCNQYGPGLDSGCRRIFATNILDLLTFRVFFSVIGLRPLCEAFESLSLSEPTIQAVINYYRKVVREGYPLDSLFAFLSQSINLRRFLSSG